MNTKPQYIIWAPAQGLPTITHPDRPTAMAEAHRLAMKHPAVSFGVYELVASLRGEVKITVEDVRPQYTTAEALPDHYPHLRPVPPELPPLPDGAVYLGRGGEFNTLGVSHRVMHLMPEDSRCFPMHMCGCNSSNIHYAAPADSEIVRINREAMAKEGGK